MTQTLDCQRLQQEAQRAEQAAQRAEQAEQKSERLAAKMREFNCPQHKLPILQYIIQISEPKS